MIDKDLKNIYIAMIKTTYVPVMRKSIVLLLIADMDRMQLNGKWSDDEFIMILRTADAKKALHICLNRIALLRANIIHEILIQYGIDVNNEMIDFYHEHMSEFFDKQIVFIKGAVARGRYDLLDRIARSQVNE